MVDWTWLNEPFKGNCPSPSVLPHLNTGTVALTGAPVILTSKFKAVCIKISRSIAIFSLGTFTLNVILLLELLTLLKVGK